MSETARLMWERNPRVKACCIAASRTELKLGFSSTAASIAADLK
jgi:hypothetical protein